LEKQDFTIRPLTAPDIEKAAALLANAYDKDIFFKWCVPQDEDRLKIVADYYKIYLRSKGCVAHAAVGANEEILGATVWLPHDADAGMYEEIEKAAGIYAPNFAAVADKSHANEPTEHPFYQLVGFGVSEKAQGRGIGQGLLKYHLDLLDERGIPTYLEASTPFYGGGVYGKFGYAPFGKLMHFTDEAILYPLYREAKKEVEQAND